MQNNDILTKEILEKAFAKCNTYLWVLEELDVDPIAHNIWAVKDLAASYGISTEHFITRGAKIEHLPEEDIFRKNSFVDLNTLKSYIVRKGIFPYKCGDCGNEGIWRGEHLPLILDHVNGDKKDTRKENIRFLCPDCDSVLNHKGVMPA